MSNRVFFFQAEDGIRDSSVTGVQTCALPILFCFLADVEIRRQTHNQKGLQDALRGILNAGGDIRHDWDLQDALNAGDKATGTSVLTDLYPTIKNQPVDVDLAPIGKQLRIHA